MAAFIVVLTLLAVPQQAAEPEATQRFDIEAGDAAVTLRKFIEQSKSQVIYLLPTVKGVRTNGIRGTYTAQEALVLMLVNSSLLHVQDRETGAMTIARAGPAQTAPPATSSGPTNTPAEIPYPRPMKSKNLLILLGTWIGLLAPADSNAAAEGNPAATSPAGAERGMITGRVFDPATGEYIRNAEVRVEGTPLVALSEEGGFYRLTNVSPGQQNVIAKYTGHETVRAVVQLQAGGTATRDFELTPLGEKARADETVRLGAFVVSTERAGQAKAISEQKNAMNVKTVVASDNFGDIFEGNVGEFL